MAGHFLPLEEGFFMEGRKGPPHLAAIRASSVSGSQSNVHHIRPSLNAHCLDPAQVVPFRPSLNLGALRDNDENDWRLQRRTGWGPSSTDIMSQPLSRFPNHKVAE